MNGYEASVVNLLKVCLPVINILNNLSVYKPYTTTWAYHSSGMVIFAGSQQLGIDFLETLDRSYYLLEG